MEFSSSVISATAGTAGSLSAAIAGETVLAWVGIGVTVVTTIVNLILDIRKKWAKTTKEIKEDKDK